MALPFAIHVEDGLIVQCVPSGFIINTPRVAIFIDGATHKVTFGCQPDLTEGKLFELLMSFYLAK